MVHSRPMFARAFGFLGAVAVIAGCGSVDSNAPSQEAGSSGTADETEATSESTITATTRPEDEFADINPTQVAKLWPISYRYVPHDSSAQLMAEPYIELAVVGTIQNVANGPIWYAESPEAAEAVPTVVVEVLVQEVLKGEAGAVGESVYLQLHMLNTLEEYNSALPQGTTVAAYLEPGGEETPQFIIGNDSAGRPAGELLWRPGPEGLVVADGETEGIVLPLLQEVDQGTTFEEALPTGS
jgi:hypothetical protein